MLLTTTDYIARRELEMLGLVQGSTINYNIQHLSNATSSQIQTWINYQLSRANASGSQGKVFSTNVRTNDVFLTLYTCGNEYDSATAQSRLYMFFKAVA